ncbi:MAG: hypothetical protein JW984_08755 [Deltaproteobacteria bacterium]|uniref:Nucleoside phosphorylase domain-containing protein n=1 Tax=Candidatus Zymogenus saltonus TaxID=2844893 RepID=A0A9D8KFK9_9DELT|nr:hypothetical protein [Candidatus Zymogenus saltonus]
MKRIGIIAALKREVKYLIKDMEEVRSVGKGVVSSNPIYEWTVNGREIIVVISGVGKKGSERAIRLLIDSYNPELIIITGYAGSLTPDLVVGDVVVYSRALSESGEHVDFIKPEPLFSTRFGNDGTVLTVDKFIGSVDGKREIGERLGAPIVDMESLYIGRIAAEKGLPCIGIRVISDDLVMEIPNLSGLLNREGEAEIVRAIRFFMSHPGTVVPLFFFLYNMRRATLILDGYIRENLHLL